MIYMRIAFETCYAYTSIHVAIYTVYSFYQSSNIIVFQKLVSCEYIAAYVFILRSFSINTKIKTAKDPKLMKLW